MSSQNPELPPLETLTPSFSEFFYTSPVAMKVLNTKNRILYANQAFQQLIGHDENILRQMAELELIHPVDLYRFRERFEKIVDHETEFSETEARHRHADGHWVPTLLNHMWLTPKDGEPEYILEVIVDLSARRDFEQPAAYHESKQLLGQMARGIAHDFNNLLTIVMMKLALLEAGTNCDETAQRTLQETSEVLERMQNLSKDLAQFGQIQPDDAEEIDVNESIHSMEKYFNYICEKSVTIEFDLADGLPKLQASAVQLEQVLLNLVVNAGDAIREKQAPGTITISTAVHHLEYYDPTKADLSPGQYVRISVQDDGAGMNDETLDRIFEPYFSTTDGTGIGLTTVYAIVRRGRGYIDVQSRPDQGTRIDIYLPAALDA